MMEKENKELFLTQLTNSPVWERFINWFYKNKDFQPRFEDNQEYSLDGTLFNGKTVRIRFLPESFLLAALVDWLDTEGVCIYPVPIETMTGTMWTFYAHNKAFGKNYTYPLEKTRSEATKAGIIKAFELLEKKI